MIVKVTKQWARLVCTVESHPDLLSNLTLRLNPTQIPKMVKLSLISEWSKLIHMLMEHQSKWMVLDKRLWTISSTPLSKDKEFQMVKLSLISDRLTSLIVLMEQVSWYHLSDKRLWITFITLLSKHIVFQLMQLVPVPILAEQEFSSRSAALVSLPPEVTKVTSGTHALTNHWLLLTWPWTSLVKALPLPVFRVEPWELLESQWLPL